MAITRNLNGSITIEPGTPVSEIRDAVEDWENRLSPDRQDRHRITDYLSRLAADQGSAVPHTEVRVEVVLGNPQITVLTISRRRYAPDHIESLNPPRHELFEP